MTKDELQYLAFLCKSEVDSMGRIAAGILRVLKLEGSVGQAAIDQLSNLGILKNFDSINEILIETRIKKLEILFFGQVARVRVLDLLSRGCSVSTQEF